MTYKYNPTVIIAVRGTLPETSSTGGGGSMENDMPVHTRKNARNGNVNMSKGLRQNSSMVKKAGKSKTQFTILVPMETSRAESRLCRH